MQVTLNAPTEKRVKRALELLQNNSDFGNIAKVATVVTIAVAKYLAELEEAYAYAPTTKEAG